MFKEKYYIIIGTLFLLGTLKSEVKASSDFLVEIFPGSILAHMDANAFTVTSTDTKESVSLISSIPNVKVGLAVAQPEGYFDFELGMGLFLNNRLRGIVLSASTGFSLEYRPNVLIGPHIQWNWLQSPEWWGEADISFKDTDGWLVGLHLATGERISYLLSIDYSSMSLPVSRVGENWTTNQNEIDLSGISVQFGIRTQF